MRQEESRNSRMTPRLASKRSQTNAIPSRGSDALRRGKDAFTTPGVSPPLQHSGRSRSRAPQDRAPACALQTACVPRCLMLLIHVCRRKRTHAAAAPKRGESRPRTVQTPDSPCGEHGMRALQVPLNSSDAKKAGAQKCCTPSCPLELSSTCFIAKLQLGADVRRSRRDGG